MKFHIPLLALLLAAIAVGPGAAQSLDSDLTQALALEKTVQKAIEQNAPAVACILVSRSDLYARFGQGPSVEQPGKLGALDNEALQKNPRFLELPDVDRKKLLRKLDLADPNLVPESSGCGVVVDEAGLVLTPYHVVHGATKIYVWLPGNKGSYADIHAADPRSDLAVLRLLRTSTKLPAVHFGDGSKAERGQFVIGLAYPFSTGFRKTSPSVAWGVIANMRQRVPAEAADEYQLKTIHQGTLLLTDARVNLGTSGGVLLNLKGEAIALTNTLAGIGGTDAAGSLAIPLTPGLAAIIDVLKKGEEVEYGFLGVRFIDRAGGKIKGAVLEWVAEGSPAEQAGLKENHVILAINGQPVADHDDVLRLLSTQLAGSKIKVDVRKPGNAAVEKVEVTLAKYLVQGKTIATMPGNRPYFRGLRVDYTSLLVQQRGTATGAIPRGVLIADVQPDSPAARADLKPGQVITHINERAVITPAAFYDIALNHKGPVQLTLQASDAGQPAPKVRLP